MIYDIDFKKNEGSGEIRKELEQLGNERGSEYLHGLLQKIDPESAALIHANNKKRVIRAIEYYRMTGQPISEHNRLEQEKASPYDVFYYVLDCARETLYTRINRRVDLMMEQGLVNEVCRLKEMGCKRGMTSMQGLGYKEILDYLDGRTSLEEAVCILKRDTRHFAKRQITWFKRERGVRWLSLESFGDDQGRILSHILKEFGQRNTAFYS